MHKLYWGVLYESFLTWVMAVAAARDTKWFSSKVYSGIFFISSKRYYFGLGRCYAYGDVDYEALDDACYLSECRTCCSFATLGTAVRYQLVLTFAQHKKCGETVERMNWWEIHRL